MRRRHTASRTAGGLALATLLGLTTLPAAAQSCGPLVERFAADHSLSTTPPPTASRRAPADPPAAARSPTARPAVRCRRTGWLNPAE